jgi:hypothetical protein
VFVQDAQDAVGERRGPGKIERSAYATDTFERIDHPAGDAAVRRRIRAQDRFRVQS